MAFNGGQYNMAKLLLAHGATRLFKDTPQYRQANEWEQIHFNYIDFYFYDCVFLRKSANKAIHYKNAEKKNYQSMYDLLQQFGMTHEEERYVFEFAIEYDWSTIIEKYKNENFLLLRPRNYYYRG